MISERPYLFVKRISRGSFRGRTGRGWCRGSEGLQALSQGCRRGRLCREEQGPTRRLNGREPRSARVSKRNIDRTSTKVKRFPASAQDPSRRYRDIGENDVHHIFRRRQCSDIETVSRLRGVSIAPPGAPAILRTCRVVPRKHCARRPRKHLRDSGMTSSAENTRILRLRQN